MHFYQPFLFLFNIFFVKFNFKKDKEIFYSQFYFIGFSSLSLIFVSALFIGMVIGMQGYFIIQTFGAEDIVGKISSLTIVRELGPVVTSILFIGRTASSITAEICLMKTTDQMYVMEVMGISFFRKVIAPRFFIGIVCMFILSMIFIVISIFGSYFSIVFFLNLDSSMFWNNIVNKLDFRIDILNSLIKSLIFSFFIMWVSLFQGFCSISSSNGIYIATTNTVVYSVLIVLFLNFFLTSLMFDLI